MASLPARLEGVRARLRRIHRRFHVEFADATAVGTDSGRPRMAMRMCGSLGVDGSWCFGWEDSAVVGAQRGPLHLPRSAVTSTGHEDVLHSLCVGGLGGEMQCGRGSGCLDVFAAEQRAGADRLISSAGEPTGCCMMWRKRSACLERGCGIPMRRVRTVEGAVVCRWAGRWNCSGCPADVETSWHLHPTPHTPAPHTAATRRHVSKNTSTAEHTYLTSRRLHHRTPGRRRLFCG